VGEGVVTTGARTRAGLAVILLGVLIAVPRDARGAELPPHDPLRILIVSDEVNPHALPDSVLTQPGEISAAITSPGAGISLDGVPDAVLEIPTDDLGTATAALAVPPEDPAAYDVLVYFAHRIPSTNGQALQDAFVAAVEDFLEAGGGVVSFHHGSYITAGKAGFAFLLGAAATGSVPWDTVDGQDVINTAPGHFVTTYGVAYDSTIAYEDPARGIPAAQYAVFTNVPDERYPTFDFADSAEEVTILFGSSYDGAARLLGFTHRRSTWQGIVVAYQPGEYEPNALDVDGNNFQILANAILYAALGGVLVDAPESAPGVPALAAWPNPFRSRVTFATPPGEGRPLLILDAAGRLVRRLDGAGGPPRTWDGLDAAGRRAAPGVYLYRLGTRTGRVVRVR